MSRIELVRGCISAVIVGIEAENQLSFILPNVPFPWLSHLRMCDMHDDLKIASFVQTAVLIESSGVSA